jgi:2-polyprenyl-6-methoxyphenol hydroxylase-like FAD-dependent oxidoreductase
MSSTALIVGAGIGGVAAGIAVRSAGWRIRIYERATTARELGFGLLLAPNALAALRELGVVDRLPAAAAGSGVEIRRTNGQVVRRFEVQPGGPAVVALRSDLYGALLTVVGEDALRLGSEVVSFAQDSSGVTVNCADGRQERGDLLIGADGINSVIRRRLHPAEPPARPSGYCAVRGVAYGVGHYLGALAAVAYLDEGLEAATTRAGSDAVYWYLSLLAKDVADEPPEPASILERRMPAFESSLQNILSRTRPDDMRFDQLVSRDPLAQWGADRVTLLGDAAHPVLPHTGQGAAQALEDAVALQLALSRGGDVVQALRRYEAVRGRRTRKLVKLGPRIARMTTTRSAVISTIRTLAIRALPERLLIASAMKMSRDPHRLLREAARNGGRPTR